MRSIVVSFLVPTVLAVPALAGSREDTLSGISRCASLPDERTFLDCIYGAAQPMRTKLGLAPAPVSQQRLVPPTTPALTQTPSSGARFATSAPQTGMLGMFNDGRLHMTGYNFNRRGLFTVTLNDGTVWRQDTADSIQLQRDTGCPRDRQKQDERARRTGTYLVERVR